MIYHVTIERYATFVNHFLSNQSLCLFRSLVWNMCQVRTRRRVKCKRFNQAVMQAAIPVPNCETERLFLKLR